MPVRALLRQHVERIRQMWALCGLVTLVLMFALIFLGIYASVENSEYEEDEYSEFDYILAHELEDQWE